MKLCPITNEPTKCTDRCRNCALDYYDELKEKAGHAELVTKDAIISELGAEAFNLMREHNLIEHCRVDENGQHWYAI